MVAIVALGGLVGVLVSLPYGLLVSAEGWVFGCGFGGKKLLGGLWLWGYGKSHCVGSCWGGSGIFYYYYLPSPFLVWLLWIRVKKWYLDDYGRVLGNVTF